MMRSSSALAAAVIVLAVLASGGVVGTAARPVATQGRVSVVAAMDRVVAVEFTGTNSAQPSNCTYGNNVGGVCPPTPPSPSAGGGGY
ncbi:unnamed protein product [Urochloa decumbens]|uniref:Uncharacterized protein n=1 Tax=Urochloa decumbens TaxID=240449 RepID=A0ABC8X502_9POAL